METHENHEDFDTLTRDIIFYAQKLAEIKIGLIAKQEGVNFYSPHNPVSPEEQESSWLQAYQSALLRLPEVTRKAKESGRWDHLEMGS
jgi:hypothetical protein